MKNLYKSIPCFAAVVLALFSTVFLQAGDKKTITLFEKSQLNDIQLDTGDYKVEVVGAGESGELYFYKGKNIVAKVPFELEKISTKIDRSSLRYQSEQGHLRRIIEVRLAGQSQVYKVLDKEKQANSKNASSGS